MNDLINQWVTKELPVQIGNKALLERVMKRLRVKSITPRVKREYVIATCKEFAEKHNMKYKIVRNEDKSIEFELTTE